MSRMLVSGVTNFAMLTGFYPFFPHRKRPRPMREVLREWAIGTGMSLARPIGYLGPRLSPQKTFRGRPILFVHGYGLSRSSFLVLAQRLLRQGFGPLYGFEYLTLDRIADNAERLGQTVEELCTRYNVDSIDIIGHSLGGLVSRYYVTCRDGSLRVSNLFTVGSPHAGIGDARFAIGHARYELLRGSEVLVEMAGAPCAEHTRIVTIASEGDTLVPAKRATFDGAENLVFPDIGHLGLLVDRRVADAISARLDGLD